MNRVEGQIRLLWIVVILQGLVIAGLFVMGSAGPPSTLTCRELIVVDENQEPRIRLKGYPDSQPRQIQREIAELSAGPGYSQLTLVGESAHSRLDAGKYVASVSLQATPDVSSGQVTFWPETSASLEVDVRRERRACFLELRDDDAPRLILGSSQNNQLSLGAKGQEPEWAPTSSIVLLDENGTEVFRAPGR